jgi:amino acid adenylation domain-containing protein
MTLVHAFLERWARETPDATAIIDQNGSTAYKQLDKNANRFANLCRAAGVTRGDRVAIALENSAELVAVYLGAMKAGAAAVPLPPGPRSDRLTRAIQDSAPRVVVINAATAREAEAHATFADVPTVFVAAHGSAMTGAELRARDLQKALDSSSEEPPDVRCIDLDLAAIIYTSGSTGEPRGVMLTHRNFVANARSIIQYLELAKRDRVMCVLPFFYVYGLSLLHTHLAVGGSLVVDNRFAFPNVVLEAMHQHQVTGFAGVPSTFALLLHRSNLGDIRLPALRYVTQAGGSMPKSHILDWCERGPRVPFYVMYGATEAAARLTYLPPEDLIRKLGSIGRAIPNVEIQVVNEWGKSAAVGEVGELVARGANVSSGYWNNAAETTKRFSPLGYWTGDLGYMDDDGFLFLVGRRHDMIKVGAHRVNAKEIEDVLLEHPAVHEAAVIGTDHELLGEAPVAFLSWRDGVCAELEAVRAFCRARLPPYKQPVRYILRADLPKTGSSGKIDRVVLRRLAVSEGTKAVRR